MTRKTKTKKNGVNVSCGRYLAVPCTSQDLQLGMSNLCNSSPSTLLAFSSADDRLRQSKKINPSFAVREAFSESEDDLAEKKIDYVIFLDPDSKETKELYEAYKALNQRGWKGSQGLWKHLSTADLIPLFIFEVKVAHLEEGEFQLMTAARAFLKYLQSLIDCSASDQKASLLKRLPPVIGWVVHKHEWKAYMSHSTDDDGWVSFST